MAWPLATALAAARIRLLRYQVPEQRSRRVPTLRAESNAVWGTHAALPSTVHHLRSLDRVGVASGARSAVGVEQDAVEQNSVRRAHLLTCSGLWGRRWPRGRRPR